MPSAKDLDIPPLEHWQQFQSLCHELYVAYKKPITEADEYGRNGQDQEGIDFILQLPDGQHGYQCKRTVVLTYNDIQDEMRKAKDYLPKLMSFTVLTTAPPDVNVQKKVFDLTEERRQDGDCTVGVVAWYKIRDILVEYPRVFKAYYPELFARFPDLQAALIRRVEREFPGTVLEIQMSATGINTVIRPGPDGIPLHTTFTRDARDKLNTMFDLGEAVTFTGDEVKFSQPEVFEEISPIGDIASRVLRLEPSFNGTEVPIRLLLEPRSAHYDVNMFARRGKRRLDAWASTLRVEAFGRRRQRFAIQPPGLPLRLDVELDFDEEFRPIDGRSTFTKEYVGQPVEAALQAEQLVETLAAGCYMGIFYENRVLTAWEVDKGQVVPSLLTPLHVLAELAAEANWDICVPERVDPELLVEVLTLTEMFKTGRRRLGSFAIAIKAETDEELANLKRFFLAGVRPLTMAIGNSGSTFDICGVEYEVPATRVECNSVCLSEEDRNSLGEGRLPFKTTVRSAPEAETWETFLEGKGD